MRNWRTTLIIIGFDKWWLMEIIHGFSASKIPVMSEHIWHRIILLFKNPFRGSILCLITCITMPYPWQALFPPACTKGEPMQELTDLDQSIKQLSDSYQVFLDAYKSQIERIDEMERMLENFRRECGLENWGCNEGIYPVYTDTRLALMTTGAGGPDSCFPLGVPMILTAQHIG